MTVDDPLLQETLQVPLHLLPQVFTPRRVELLQTLQAHGPFPTQAKLAETLGRAAPHVSVDLRYLEGLGLVERHDGIRATTCQVVVSWDHEP